MLIVAVLTFIALMLAAAAMFFWMAPTATAQRLQALAPKEDLAPQSYRSRAS